MGKLPGFTFYPGDWLKDPALRSCSWAAKGVWIDMLCLMFECEPRGMLVTNGVTWTVQKAAHALPGDESENVALIEELLDAGVATIAESGEICCKRMIRDELVRKQTKARVWNHRHGTEDVTHDVTQEKRPSTEMNMKSTSSFEVDLKEDDLSQKVLRIAQMHPANAHRRESLTVVPHDQAVAIMGAIETHGVDMVIAGTRNYGDAVARWPEEGKASRVKGAARFYREADYLRNPRQWEEQGYGRAKPSATAERTHNTKNNIIDGLGLQKDVSRRDEPNGAELQVGAGKRISG